MNIVVVAPAFPPYAGVGGMRMASLAGYLVKQGINVIVVRNHPETWGTGNLLADVPGGVKVFDVPTVQDFEENARLYTAMLRCILLMEPVDLIIYSLGPYYTLRTAKVISQEFKTRYLLDFRDLWTFEKRYHQQWFTRLKVLVMRGKHWLIEYPATIGADAVVVVTPQDQLLMVEHYPQISQRIHTVYNGFEEWVNHHKQSTPQSHQLVVLGKMSYYAPHLVDELMAAVAQLSDQAIQLKHIGHHETFVDQLVVKKEYHFYECTGYLAYQHAMEMTSQADIGVIICNHQSGLGTKIYDYIACNLPIILLCDNSPALEQFVQQFKYGYVCHNKAELVKTINYLIKHDIRRLDDQLSIDQYSRLNQNIKYYELVDQLLNK